jgi:hypothetical protein
MLDVSGDRLDNAFLNDQIQRMNLSREWGLVSQRP